ncbi:MAG: hypothetical protein ISS57_01235 [Anaerolineales bacterium]|nr:hypothetical protein [Anaerolineales bacterium]
MSNNPLKTIEGYSRFVAELLDHARVENSTVTVWSVSKYTGIAEGEVFLTDEYRLRMREEIDFDEGVIASYGYEVYRGDERLYWYDDFPHPNDQSLASTHPHHKHVPPDIKHNRIPAPGISFSRPNLPLLLQEIEELTGLKADG